MSDVEFHLNNSFLQNHQKSLSETSYDDFNDMKMIEDIDDQIVHFDDVKTAFCSSYGQKNDALDSVDGLLYNEVKDRLVFLEFRNGKINNREGKRKAKTKLKDSLLVFTNLTGLDLEFCRNHCEYVLVYNPDKNKGVLDKQDIPISDGYREFVDIMSELAQKEVVFFELEVLQKVCVKTIHTYDVDQFRQYYEQECQ